MAEPPLALTPTELKARLNGFVREYLQNKSPETVGTYRRTLNEFERYFALRQESFRFRPSDVEAYKQYLTLERGLREVSVSTYLTGLRRFCQYLVDTGLLQTNPAAGVKGNPRPSDHMRRALTHAEIARLKAVLETATVVDLRDRAIVLAMLHAGLSEIEIVRADVQDLEQTLVGWFLRVQGKGRTSKDQQVSVEETLAMAIEEYLRRRRHVRPEQPLFASHGPQSEGTRLLTRSVRSRVNRLLRLAGLKDEGVSPHSLTHTAPLLWLEAGLSLEEVRRRMRHGTITTTQIYVRQQGALDGAPPAD
jgi:integrase/recombinase XerC